MNPWENEILRLFPLVILGLGFLILIVMLAWAYRRKREINFEKIAMNTLVICWIGLLLFAPLFIIASFHEQNAIGLGLGIGITMFLYWVTGILTAMMKGWKLDRVERK